VPKAKTPSLTDDVAESLKACVPKTWWDGIPPDAQAELLAVRAKFKAGGYEARRGTVARVLAERCRERGWKTCDHKRFAEWLQKD
jgi:hypothetical protein